MKKIAFLMSGIAAAGMLFFSSCSSDSTTPGDIHPSMNFKGGGVYVSSDATLEAASTFKVGINAFSSTESNAKLANFKVTRIFNNKPSVEIDSALNVTQFSMDMDIIANPEAGVEYFTFDITDKDNQTVQLSFTITTEIVVVAGPINTFSMTIMGAQGNAAGSSFASINGIVYGGMDAKTNSDKIDWVYFYGATNLATIAAPDDLDAQEVFTNPTYGIPTWAVKNPTRFKKITTAVDWAAITDDATIVTLTETGVDQSKANTLAAGNVLGFITATGKKGLIQVETISGTTDGTITISVKVQQ